MTWIGFSLARGLRCGSPFRVGLCLAWLTAIAAPGGEPASPAGESSIQIEAARGGCRVAVPGGRTYHIEAFSGLSVPPGFCRLRAHVTEVGGGAKWFIRLYGELRRPGEFRTASLAEGETGASARVFDSDPRLRTLAAPLQLQLGVEGPPGAFAVFSDVAFLSPPLRTNRVPLASPVQPGQISLAAVELMPNLPEPWVLIDWREKARAYDRFVFDPNARGEFLPLVWIDDSRINLDRPTFGLPSYVGAPDQGPGKRNSQEGITCMGAVLGATLVGIDKSRQDRDYVDMCAAWFNARNGMDLVLNRQEDFGGGSFWYELFPHVVFYALADRYPDKPRLQEIVRRTADRWRDACAALSDSHGVPDFDHTAYDFRARKPVDNGKWREPDAAAAVAWLEYAAWIRFHDTSYLAAAENCLRFLQDRKANPYYEVLLPFGAVTAARLNAEQGGDFDLQRLLDWCFGISDCRGGWGVTLGNWGGYDCDGLLGSIDNRGGYAFAMNTFAQAGALVPVARYDCRYARALGKWMLNLANSARLFYPAALPPGHGSSEFWTGDPQHVVAYEGLRFEWMGKSPCATGDPVAMHWDPKTDLGLYGSGYVGLLGAIVSPTTEARILRLDCLATDFFHSRAFPTYLYFNPHLVPRSVRVPVGGGPARIYDAVSHRFLPGQAPGEVEIVIPADAAIVAVVVPADARVHQAGRKLLADDVVVDFALPVAPSHTGRP